MITLYESGKLIGAVQKFEFHQGQKEVIDLPTFGGMHYVQGRREPDDVTFQLPFFHNNIGIHELVDEKDNVMEITYVNISSSNKTSFVKAKVHLIRKF